MFRTAISTDIQELMNNQRKALGDLAEQVAEEATRDVQQALTKIKVRNKTICLTSQF